jgi:ribosomal protein S18 acetylase RimI-like enzyme
VANVVADQEIVTRTFPEGPGEIDVLALYEIAENKIAKAWFKMGAPRLYPLDSLPLRSATNQDVEAIRTLTRAAYAEWVPVIGREPKPMTADYAEAVKKHRIDLLHIDGKLVALIEMIPQNDHLLIENVAVSPAFQNRGLGRRLLAHAERVTASLGCELVKLYTHKMFVKSIELYARYGYGVDREEAFWGGITVYMSKRVNIEG